MDKPGRNDPCYCGSGKKYKQCHLAADLAAEQQARQAADVARRLRADLLDYADDEQFDSAVADALPIFWSGYYTAENSHLMDAFEAERFYDWFLFDYWPREGDWTRPAESYAGAGSLNDAQQSLLTQWLAATPMGGYLLEGYEGQTLHLRDYLTDEAVDVFLPSGHGSAPLGSLIVGRVVPIEDQREFFTPPAYIPPNELGNLKEILLAAMAEVLANNPAATRNDQLRQTNHLIMVQGLEQAKKAGRPPVARLDPNRTSEGQRARERHERTRVQGPSGVGESRPQMTETRRKVV